ncbi:MAG: hypothetical protein QXT25_03955 [Candidatus Anstonellaceae archaeon]
MDKVSAAVYLGAAVFLAAVSFQSIFPHAIFIFGLSVVGSFFFEQFKKAGTKSPELIFVAVAFLCFLAVFLSFRLSAKGAFYLLPLPISICIPAIASYFER